MKGIKKGVNFRQNPFSFRKGNFLINVEKIFNRLSLLFKIEGTYLFTE